MPLRLSSWRISSRVAKTMQAGLVALAVFVSMGATDPDLHFQKLGSKLMCTCGCAQSLLGCDHVGCPSRGEEMAKLSAGIASGRGDAEILDSFVTDYGKVVLGAPTTQGFDLVAWIMPFAVSAVALLATIFLVRHWVKNQPKLAEDGIPLDPAEAMRESEMQERIRRETGTV
jgi:cytochrome c-type biogenesis protein CcmH/NrfF